MQKGDGPFFLMNYSETCLDRIPLLQQSVVLEDSWSLKILTDQYCCHTNVDFQDSLSLKIDLIYIVHKDLCFLRGFLRRGWSLIGLSCHFWSQMLYVKSTRYLCQAVGIHIFELCPLKCIVLLYCHKFSPLTVHIFKIWGVFFFSIT